MVGHFDMNPNESIQMAGWPTLKAFDVGAVDTTILAPEAMEISITVTRISEPGVRGEVTDATLTLLNKYS